MKKVLRKFAMVAAIMATMFLAQTTVDCLSPIATAQDQASDSPYVWGTLRMVAGIAVCDGAAYNCTRPRRADEPSVPIEDAGQN